MGSIPTIWRLTNRPEQILEPVKLEPEPQTMDEAARKLPGGGYTTFRTFGRNKVLPLRSHFHRLEETACLAGKEVGLDEKMIRAGLRMALAAFPDDEMRVRIILDLEQEPGTLYILVEGLKVPSEQDFRQGVRVVTRQMRRDNPKAKLTNFIETASAVRKELPEGVNEAVMFDEHGRALEGLSSNFFAVKDGEVWTADQGVLSGITRSLVLDLIDMKGIPVRLEGAALQDLDAIDEAFLTSASRAVLPVTEIDGRKVGDGVPGLVTRMLQEKYRKRVEEELETV